MPTTLARPKPSVPDDLMKLEEIVAFLGQSGRPISMTTARRWARSKERPIRNWAPPGRGPGLYSLSDYLESHREAQPRKV
ncbi:hypothetical protein ABTX81_30335 [Kitasatospora sp. NPDC097605]|uniref:hypothetical protein n=1 Tax=Kitasatospora sp. NPDC097605 TaxID=3157226 RepID=UPI0033283FD6